MLIKNNNSLILKQQRSRNLILSTEPTKRVKGFLELGYIIKGRKTIVKRKSTKRMGVNLKSDAKHTLNSTSFSVYGLQGTVIFITKI